MSPSDRSGRYLPLEALRGLAALGMLVYHFFLAFVPNVLSYQPPAGLGGALVGSPMLVLMNGKAMLVILLILSGYVLSLKGLHPESDRIVSEAIIKRWFRFVPLITASLLFSYALYELDLYYYENAYDAGASVWLHHYADMPQHLSPSFSAIMYDALWGSLIHGNNHYNVVLWTMQVEYFGSLMVFALAYLFVPQRRWWLWLSLLLCAYLLIQQEFFWFLPFLIGVFCLALGMEYWRLNRLQTLSVLLPALYLCGYYYPVGAYAWFARVPLSDNTLRFLIFNLGGFMILLVFATRNFVSAIFQGPVSAWLGKTSFPLYLFHTLIMMSFGAHAYVAAGGGMKGASVAALVIVVIAVPVVCILAVFDRWWLRLLARWHPLKGRQPI